MVCCKKSILVLFLLDYLDDNLTKTIGATDGVGGLLLCSPKLPGKCNIFPIEKVNKDVRNNVMRRRWEN